MEVEVEGRRAGEEGGEDPEEVVEGDKVRRDAQHVDVAHGLPHPDARGASGRELDERLREHRQLHGRNTIPRMAIVWILMIMDLI